MCSSCTGVWLRLNRCAGVWFTGVCRCVIYRCVQVCDLQVCVILPGKYLVKSSNMWIHLYIYLLLHIFFRVNSCLNAFSKDVNFFYFIVLRRVINWYISCIFITRKIHIDTYLIQHLTYKMYGKWIYSFSCYTFLSLSLSLKLT